MPNLNLLPLSYHLNFNLFLNHSMFVVSEVLTCIMMYNKIILLTYQSLPVCLRGELFCRERNSKSCSCQNIHFEYNTMLLLRQLVKSSQSIQRFMSTVSSYNYETLAVTSPSQFVYLVTLNRPDKKNAMNKKMWIEIRECFRQVNDDADCRAVVLASKGNVFCAGLDLIEASQHLVPPGDDVGRRAFILRKLVREVQDSLSSLEKCLKPVIAAIQGACIGGAMGLITAADIRYSTKSAWFQIKEVDIGIAADIGTLQRFPKITGNDSLGRELAYTARKLEVEEAEKVGLVSRVFPDHESLLAGSINTATVIASKSPIAVQGSKRSLVYSRDHSVQEGLDDVSNWNQAMLQSEDMMKSVTTAFTKEKAEFAKL